MKFVVDEDINGNGFVCVCLWLSSEQNVQQQQRNKKEIVFIKLRDVCR